MNTASLRVEWVETPGAGRGLVSLSDSTAREPLMSIPQSAVLSAHTLAPFYPPKTLPAPGNVDTALTAVQGISLYLAAHRHVSNCPWAPYINVLPADFDDHPVNAIVSQRCGRKADEPDRRKRNTALSLGPPSFLGTLHEVVARCEKDLEVIRAFISTRPRLFDLGGKLESSDFLWGWLNVNTRQVWVDLNLAKHDNLALVPIFDMCNHTSGSGGELKPSPFSRSVSLHVPYDVKKGDPVCIQYGSHSNAKLLAEYGFVLDPQQSSTWEVRVTDLVLDMLKREGKRGSTILSSLEQYGYSPNDFAFHFQPEPAGLSYGLIVALRLLHTDPLTEDHSAWFEVLWSGDFARRYPSVDGRVTASLHSLCSAIVERAEAALDLLQDKCGPEGEEIKALWREEIAVALAVEASLRRGLVDFD